MYSDDDKRIRCKYGRDCYQRNPEHLAKYKHPVKRSVSPENSNSTKRQKLNTTSRKEVNNSEDETTETNVNTNEENEPELVNEEVEASSEIETTEDLNQLDSLEDKKQFIKDKFLVTMPDDFYSFWQWCMELNEQKPKEALKAVRLTLVGPYDVLDKSFKAVNGKEEYLLHWRYYFDPPEFQTIIKGDDNTGFHIGYYRDSPDELPVFVAKNEEKSDCTITSMGPNVFAAVNAYLEHLSKTVDPFKKIPINNIQRKLTNKAKELDIDLNKNAQSIQKRNTRTVCKTYHKAGIVVPYNRKTELGYRKLPVVDNDLRKLLDKVAFKFSEKGNQAFTDLQPLLTAATIANDECDFGAGLELGINLFCYGNDCFNSIALRLLSTTYMLLNRSAFADIANAHLNKRSKGRPFILGQK